MQLRISNREITCVYVEETFRTSILKLRFLSAKASVNAASFVIEFLR